LFIRLQLYREIKVYSSIIMFAYHIDSTTLADGDYQLIPEPEGDNSEDLGNIIRDLTEAPNPGSENFSIDVSDPSPTVAEPIRLNYYGSCALVIAIQTIVTQCTSNGTTHWSVWSLPDTTTVQQD
jgi:hypothetical protein